MGPLFALCHFVLFVCSVSWLFLLGCQYQYNASDWLERFVSEMTYSVLMGTLIPILTHSVSVEI